MPQRMVHLPRVHEFRGAARRAAGGGRRAAGGGRRAAGGGRRAAGGGRRAAGAHAVAVVVEVLAERNIGGLVAGFAVQSLRNPAPRGTARVRAQTRGVRGALRRAGRYRRSVSTRGRCSDCVVANFHLGPRGVRGTRARSRASGPDEMRRVLQTAGCYSLMSSWTYCK